MESEKIPFAVGVLACLVIAVAANWYLIDLVNQETKGAVLKSLANPKPGPFDEAMAEMIGVACFDKSKSVVPLREPVSVDFDPGDPRANAANCLQCRRESPGRLGWSLHMSPSAFRS